MKKIKNIGQGDSASNIASNERRDSVGDVLNPTAGGNADQKAAGNLADSASGVSDSSIANENDTVKFQLENPEHVRFQLDEFDAYIDVEDLIEENTRLQ